MMWCLCPSSVRRRRTGARIIFLLPRQLAESSFLRLFVGRRLKQQFLATVLLFLFVFLMFALPDR
jgi:hypothetical protein